MSRVLVVADGLIADSFIDKIADKKITEVDYTVVYKDKCNIKIENSNIEFVYFDATSRYRLKKVCQQKSYLAIYIIMDNPQEAKEVYKNIRSFNKKMRVVVLDNNKSFKDIEDSYLNSVDAPELLANRLYDFLPNVPVVAQTIGLNEGEIMEVMVPFASSYAYRHIGTIPQIKWKIVAIYRDNKLILPTTATMIKPRDRLLLVGKPQVLANVYNRIKNKSGVFPEPFGKNFYLFVDLNNDLDEVFRYIKEAILFVDNFANRELIIRVSNPHNLEIVNKIKDYEADNIRVYIKYDDIDQESIYGDIQSHDIGMILISYNTFAAKEIFAKFYDYRKLIYMFGDESTISIKEAIIVNSNKKKIEEISTIAFYVAEAFKLKLSLGIYNPNGELDNQNNKEIVEHFETLSHVYSYPIEIVKENKNPIKDIREKSDTLLILPYSNKIDLVSVFAYFYRDIDSLLFRIKKHPKLLIPIEEDNS
jgi:hypothetical protein